MAENAAFFDTNVAGIEGWLHRHSALLTMDILQIQERRNIQGGLYEIGVYAGKYFSLLAHSGRRTQSRVLGIDTFQFVPVDQVKHNLRAIADESHYSLWAKPSTAVRPHEIITEIGGRARFVSIDGSHECDDVVHDLRLAENTLSDEGVLSVDDFINPVAIGVNEAVNRYFGPGTSSLIPWAHVDNKLFFCRRGREGSYREEFERVLDASSEAIAAVFRDRRAHYRPTIDQSLFGAKVLTVVP